MPTFFLQLRLCPLQSVPADLSPVFIGLLPLSVESFKGGRFGTSLPVASKEQPHPGLPNAHNSSTFAAVPQIPRSCLRGRQCRQSLPDDGEIGGHDPDPQWRAGAELPCRGHGEGDPAPGGVRWPFGGQNGRAPKNKQVKEIYIFFKTP